MAAESGRDWPDIALIGGYPPPYGGITVHMQRLAGFLDAGGFDYVLYNTVSPAARAPRVVSVARRRGLWFLWFCLRHRCRIVHLVSGNSLAYVLLGAAAFLRGGRYVLSIHNMVLTDSLAHGRPWRRRLYGWLLRQMDVVVVCNREIESRCVDTLGLLPAKVRLIPAFIPPNPGSAAGLPADLRDFVEGHRPVLCATAWLGRLYNGHDLYGVDMLFDLIERLSRDHDRIGFVLTLLGGGSDKVEAVREDARRRVGSRLFIVDEPLDDASGLIARSDLFLRPTNTDGDANSVREALHLGTPVVASDVVRRPEPCIVFRTRDIDDFELKVREALSNLPPLRERVQACRMPNNAHEIMQIYRELNDLERRNVGTKEGH